jgi:hypothetical protein
MSAEAAAQPSEEQLRAYEAELSRITSVELVVQAVASLLNVGARRLGVGEDGGRECDLEQVRDAIDAVMALLPILERRMPSAQARPLRDALSQLQIAYARAASSQQAAGTAAASSQAGAEGARGDGEQQRPAPGGAPESAGGGAQGGGQGGAAPPEPGPAERSGRLWVPGR